MNKFKNTTKKEELEHALKAVQTLFDRSWIANKDKATHRITHMKKNQKEGDPGGTNSAGEMAKHRSKESEDNQDISRGKTQLAAQTTPEAEKNKRYIDQLLDNDRQRDISERRQRVSAKKNKINATSHKEEDETKEELLKPIQGINNDTNNDPNQVDSRFNTMEQKAKQELKEIKIAMANLKADVNTEHPRQQRPTKNQHK